MAKFKQIETFVAVAARGSLSAAAAAEGVAPAVVGRRLDALEERLGVKLLTRTTRRTTLTPEGAAFLENCQQLLAEWAEAEASVSAGRTRATGHLRITAPAGFGRRHVAPLVPGFHAAHPDVTVSLNLSDRLVDLAGEGIDCAVRVGDMPDSSLVSVRLADNRRLCVATPDFLRRHGMPRHPSELAGYACLALSSDASQTRGWAFKVPRPDAATDARAANRSGSSSAADRFIAEPTHDVVHLKPHGPLDCSDGQVLHAWCLAGHGIAWRSSWEVEAEIAAGLLVEVLADFAAPPNGIHAVFAQRKHLPQRVRLWIEFLQQQYRQPGFWRAVHAVGPP